jgi:hypothetical protein
VWPLGLYPHCTRGPSCLRPARREQSGQDQPTAASGRGFPARLRLGRRHRGGRDHRPGRAHRQEQRPHEGLLDGFFRLLGLLILAVIIWRERAGSLSGCPL